MSFESPITNSMITSTKPIGAGALHDAERDRPAADLLGQRPEDVAAVEGQEREQIDHGEGQGDQREQRAPGRC